MVQLVETEENKEMERSDIISKIEKTISDMGLPYHAYAKETHYGVTAYWAVWIYDAPKRFFGGGKLVASCDGYRRVTAYGTQNLEFAQKLELVLTGR